ncbi:MAG: hypothetical protein ACYC21_03230 [Eubacteriales bacterium]
MRVTAFRVGRLKGKALLVLIVCCLFIFFCWRSVHNFKERIDTAELISETFPGKVPLVDRESLNCIDDRISNAGIAAGGEHIKGRYKLVLTRGKKVQTYYFDKPANLFEPQTGKWLTLSDGGKCLDYAVKQLEGKNPYGEFMMWEEVDEVFRKYDKARVVDFDTGLSFMVQRRAGRNHADVQPLTAGDSAIMKKIYGGRWSWKRRAVVLEIKGRRIAASMNGMPHGAGTIAGNDFNGHFCIHFRDSKTHTEDKNDAHQIMVWKAAGTVEEMLANAGPEDIIRFMLVAMEQNDCALAARLFQPTSQVSEKEIAWRLDNIRWLAVARISKLKGVKDTHSYNLLVSYGLSDGTLVRNGNVTFTLVRNQGQIPWKIKSQNLDQFFQKQKETGQQEPALRGETII